MIDLTLTLDYQLHPGWLAPWVDGILQGKAVAHSCAACGQVSFVPQRTCDCGETEGAWKTLPGTATILNVTDGVDGCFGLVRFDGANTSCVARLSGFTSQPKRGQIITPKAGLPAVIVAPIVSESR